MFAFLLAASAMASDYGAAKPIDRLPDPAPTTVETPADAPAAPAAVDAIRPLLRARHTTDLPDKTALDHHAGAEEALRWLAQHGATLVESERAAGLLAHYDSADTTAVCTALLEGQGHAKVRAGAARCLSGQTADAVQPLLVRSLTDADVRVGVAAADALVLRPGAVDGLDKAMVATLPEVVKAHLQVK